MLGITVSIVSHIEPHTTGTDQRVSSARWQYHGAPCFPSTRGTSVQKKGAYMRKRGVIDAFMRKSGVSMQKRGACEIYRGASDADSGVFMQRTNTSHCTGIECDIHLEGASDGHIGVGCLYMQNRGAYEVYKGASMLKRAPGKL